jgi:hypothetical protein
MGKAIESARVTCQSIEAGHAQFHLPASFSEWHQASLFR